VDRIDEQLFFQRSLSQFSKGMHSQAE